MKFSVIKYLGAASLAATLTACGGGGDSMTTANSGSGTTAATSSASTLSQQDAAALARAAVDASNSTTQLSSSAASASSTGSAPTEKSLVAKAISVSYDCASNIALASQCVGQYSANSNLTPAAGGGIPAGTNLNMSFVGFRLLTMPVSQAVTGTISITFTDAFTSSTLLNGSAKIKVDLSSPAPEVHTDVGMTFHNMSVSGTGSDRTLSGRASLTMSGMPAMEVGFVNWRNVGTTPQPGSVATLSTGADTASIAVVSSSTLQTAFDVTTSIAGAAPTTRRVVQNVVNGQATYALQ